MSKAAILGDAEDWIDTRQAQAHCKAFIEAVEREPRRSFLMIGEYVSEIIRLAASPMDSEARARALRSLDFMVDGDCSDPDDGSGVLQQIYALAALAHFHGEREGEGGCEDD